jgi:prepilin-type N-terminal cleavage/methylation domain-containing protein
MIRKKRGLTLVEVIIAMTVMSILLVTFIAGFSNAYIMIMKGKGITQTTFEHQERLENLMLSSKQELINNPDAYTMDIEIFEGAYKSIIPVLQVKTESGSKTYYTYVSNMAIKEPPMPIIANFEVGVFEKGTNTKVFPWYDDNIEIRAQYTLSSNPLIFENREKWYVSKAGVINPRFSSDYDISGELNSKTPSGVVVRSIDKISSDTVLLPSRFYYYESAPYTLLGKQAFFKNKERLLILKKAGSQVWQNFVESVYFKNAVVFHQVKGTVFTEVSNNPLHPTLNVDWSENYDSQGALVGVNIPAGLIGKDITTVVDFEFDHKTGPDSNKLMGIGVVNSQNSGFMFTLNPMTNTLSANVITLGEYQQALGSWNLLSHPGFSGLLKEVEGIQRIDWTTPYQMLVSYHKESNIIVFSLNSLEDLSIASSSIELELGTLALEPRFIGLKSSTNIDYIPNSRFEIVDVYDRNYAAHFYNTTISEQPEWIFGSAAGFYEGGPLGQGNSSVIVDGKKAQLVVLMNRKNSRVNGNGNQNHHVTIEAKAVQFMSDIEKLIVNKKSKLTVIVKDYVWFNSSVDLADSSSELVVRGTNESDTIKIYFKQNQKLSLNGGEVFEFVTGQGLILSNGDAIITKGVSDVLVISGNVSKP